VAGETGQVRASPPCHDLESPVPWGLRPGSEQSPLGTLESLLSGSDSVD
jgi:hypothetical protein